MTQSKVLIIGAHGKVGQILSDKLHHQADFKPTGFIRKSSQQSEFKIETIVQSLSSTVDELTETFKGFDAIVFAAGSGGNTGHDKTLEVDLDGAVKAIEAAEKASVKRFLMLSAFGAGNRTFIDDSPIKHYYIAKHYADKMLQSTSLDWTILRPGRLTDDNQTGKITLDKEPENASISRTDVAETIVECLKHQNTVHKIIEFNEGDTAIDHALTSL